MVRIALLLSVFFSIPHIAGAQEVASLSLSSDLNLPPGLSLASAPDETSGALFTDDVYNLNYKVDIPVTAVGMAWSFYAFSKIYSKDQSPIADVEALDKNNINGFDRWAAGKSSLSASSTSDYLFYGSIPLPFLLLADKKIRKDAYKVGFLYLESMAITGLLYTGSTYFVDRYRPEAYNTNLPAQERISGNLRNSFFAGHVALVGTSTFFMAKIYNDYHPGSNFRWVMFGAAAAATGTTAYLRHRAGKHFPSDIVLGTAIGTLSGILVPHFHKNKLMKGNALMIMPSIGNGYGFTAVYKFQ